MKGKSNNMWIGPSWFVYKTNRMTVVFIEISIHNAGYSVTWVSMNANKTKMWEARSLYTKAGWGNEEKIFIIISWHSFELNGDFD